MIKVVEVNKKDIAYKLQYIENKVVLQEKYVYCRLAREERNGKTYIALFDNSGKIIQNVFSYLNTYLSIQSLNSKENSATALKYLYSCAEIFQFDVKKMTSNDSAMFISFLSGDSKIGLNFSTSFNSIRSLDTINLYLSCIRNYIRYLGIEKHPLLETQGVKKLGNGRQVVSYKLTRKSSAIETIPPYIKLNEYTNMSKLCIQNKDDQLHCMIMLMFTRGLRIGELLGLTREDLVELEPKIDENTGEVKRQCFVVIRNRCSDNPDFQHAKNLVIPTTQAYYKTDDYKLEFFGWTRMSLSPEMYDYIVETVERIHTKAIKKNKDMWLKNCGADIVDDNTYKSPYNYYLFLNSISTPMSNISLGVRVKELFNAVDIKIDRVSGGKYDNICHRFRHGFAMYLVKEKHFTQMELKAAMRQTNIHSCEVYFTPDDEDLAQATNDIVKEFYDEFLPENYEDKENKTNG